LKGKRIGVSRIGSSSHAAIEIALEHFKVDAKRDNITFVQSGTMTTRVAGLRAGAIDATVVDPSFVPFMLKEGYKDLGYLGKFGIPYQHESLDSSKAYLAKHRDTALKAVKGIVEGIAFIAQERNGAEVKRVLGKYLKFGDPAKVDAKRDGITFVQSGTMTTRVAGLRAGAIDATVVDPSFVPFMLKEGYKDLGYLGKFGIPYQHESLDSSKAYLAKHRDTALKAVKGIVEGIAFIAQERNGAEVKRVLGKYLKFGDPAKIDDAYKALRGYAISIRKPYPTKEGVASLIAFLAKFNPKVAQVTVDDVVDSSLVAELDKTGFIDAVYKEMGQGK
ncbi:MAG TPA: ABC transporter substrate-binding protein, partial [Candidatus Binatia bacterium]|nr:ABC transporter substrate-binding protein [Candidatus Binatia bacterium]